MEILQYAPDLRYPVGGKIVTGKLIAMALGGVVLVGAACGLSPKEVNQASGNAGSTSTSSGGAGATTTTKGVAHVGASLTLSGETSTKISVTLVKVMDPATPATSFTAVGTGKRLVGAEFTLRDVGSKAVTGDANNAASAVGSNGQSYTPTFSTIAGCTNFQSGQFQLGANESATGCVAFAVPSGVTIAKIKWSPSAGFATDFGEWVVP